MKPAPPSAQCEIAYCVPVMNRLDDLRETLPVNVEAIRPFQGRAQLVVISFDADGECADWIRRSFTEELDTGILRFDVAPPLPYWHFSWAKNAFRRRLGARYYSSLDGDNFLTRQEITLTLALLQRYAEDVMIHHFSGEWGDGTSGRITLPVRIFDEVGYPGDILPRQADDLALILATLCKYPATPLLSRPGVDIFRLSRWLNRFKRLNHLTVRRIEVDLGTPCPPLNPRGEGYAFNDPDLHWQLRLNSTYVSWKLSRSAQALKYFGDELQSTQRRYARSTACSSNLLHLFRGSDLDRLRNDSCVTVYAVGRNNHAFLPAWFDHYRKLGVHRFVVVDDGSTPSYQEVFTGEDLFFVQPSYGMFKIAKAFWIQALLAQFQAEGSWVFTVDTDEFVDIADSACNASSRRNTLFSVASPDPSDAPTRSAVDQLIAACRARNRSFRCGILLDMMPGPEAETINAHNYTCALDHFYYRPVNLSSEYRRLRSVRWAWGDFWPISYSLDLRYHFFGTQDCLRKVPFFLYSREIDVHQGFHTLATGSRNLCWWQLLDATSGLLPIRHFKMTKLFAGSDAAVTSSLLERCDQYFDRTQKNLGRIARAEQGFIRDSWQLTPFRRRYTDALAFPFYDRLCNQ